MKVVIVGLGYVGLPIAVKTVEAGHVVIGVDVSQQRLASLLAGHSYSEDVSEDRLQAAWDTGRFAVHDTTTPLVDFDIALIAVPTPVNANKQPDLAYIESASRYLAKHLHSGSERGRHQAVVLESTTYPGTTEDVVARIIRQESGLVPVDDYHLGYSPERINPGDKVNTFDKVPKIVSGVGPAALQVVQEFYDTIVDETVPVSSPRAAEMAKIVENTHSQVNIALVNEIALMCSDLGLDVDEVLDAAATKGHAFARWRPGPGVGGHCISVDPLYLAYLRRTQYGKAFKFAELADEVNSHMPEHVANRARDLLRDMGKNLWESRILALGEAYKPGVADVRESPAVDAVNRLRERGADVQVMDPHSRSPEDADLATKVAADVDLVIVLTDHAEFQFEQILAQAKAVLDTRNVYPSGKEKVYKL